MSDKVLNNVPRELLGRASGLLSSYMSTLEDRAVVRGCIEELRALLSEQPQASAAQSAPAGEREAFEARYSVPEGILWSGASYGPSGRQHQLSPAVFVGLCGQAARLDAQLEAFQAGAAWQRTQSAGVPEGWRLVPDYAGADEVVTALYRRFKDWSARGFSADDVTWCEVKADVLAMLAAAPAQLAAHDQGEVQRLREALTELRDAMRHYYPYPEINPPAHEAIMGRVEAALAASTGQEV